MSTRPESILVVRHDNIGDLVCTTPLLRGLRAQKPAAKITALVNTYNRPVLEGSQDVDEVLAYVKRAHNDNPAAVVAGSMAKVLTLLRLRWRRFDTMVVAATPMSPRLERLARTVRPRHLVAATTGRGRGWVPVDPATLSDLHEVERVWQLGRACGLSGPPPALQLTPTPATITALRDRLPALAGVKSPGQLVAVHLSSRKASQQWPAEHFARLLGELHRRFPDLGFLLLWAPGSESAKRHPGDDEKAGRLAVLLGSSFPAIPCPTPSLPETIAALSLARHFIGSDGGAMHLAAALGLRVVCLFGQSSTVQWRPWTPDHILLQAPSREVRDITPHEVAEAFDKLASA